MGSRKNIEQEKNKRSRKVFDMVEGIYGGGGYLGKKIKLKKRRRTDRRVRTKGNSGETTSRRGRRI